MQAVISNAGTTAMDENDSVRIDYSMADQKNVKVNRFQPEQNGIVTKNRL